MEAPPAADLAYHETQAALEVSRQFGFRVMLLSEDSLADASRTTSRRPTPLRSQNLPVAFPAKANKVRVPIKILK